METTTKMGAGRYAVLSFDVPYTEDEIIDVMEAHGRRVVKHGAGPGSLESDDTAGLDYIVMTTRGIREHLPKLWDLYADRERLAEVGALVGEQVEIKDTEDAINLNYVKAGGRYERHLDSEPYTVLVFVSSFEPGDGGELAVYEALHDETPAAAFMPSNGVGILFDGSLTAHTVLPTDRPRVSMPMVYAPVQRRVNRDDAATDSYLYGEQDG